MSWVKKLGEALIFLWLLTVLSFLVVKLAPGDSALSMLRIDTVSITQSEIEALRDELGLNAPLWQQYLTYMGNLFQLNLGTSTMTGKAVLDEIAAAFPYTLLLAGWSLAVTLLLSGVLGVISARKVNKWPDRFVLGFCLIGASIPTFWLGLLLINLFAVRLGMLPSMGLKNGGLILPVVALAVAITPPYVKVFRNSLIESQDLDFVRASRSRGLREATVFTKHVLRASLIPLVTIVGMSLGSLLGGTVIVEKVFGIPGIGKLALEALTRRDYAIIQALILLLGISVFVINTVVDLSYRWLDPAIALKGKRPKEVRA